jgi:hypothetical protein
MTAFLLQNYNICCQFLFFKLQYAELNRVKPAYSDMQGKQYLLCYKAP